jgi:acyl-coenzyme A synthetase/AMP-(fatty) acid ligase
VCRAAAQRGAVVGVKGRAAHPVGQAILVVATAAAHPHDLESRVIAHCRDTLPGFMVPQRVLFESDLPRNPNGKIDRKLLASRFEHLFRVEPS